MTAGQWYSLTGKGVFFLENYSSCVKSFITTFVLVNTNLKGFMVSRVFTE